MITLSTVFIWLLTGLGGVLAGHATVSKTVPAWIRSVGIIFIICDGGLFVLSLTGIATHFVVW